MTGKGRINSPRRSAIGVWLVTLAWVIALLAGTSGTHWNLLAQSVAVAGAAAGVLTWVGLTAAGWWLGITILGAAASLQLVDAGPRVWYQHLVLPWAADTGPRQVAVFILVLQALCLGLFWRRRAREAWRWLTQTFGTWRVIALAVLMVLTSATVSRAVDFYIQELLVASALQFLALGSVAATIVAMPPNARAAISATTWQWLEPPDDTPTTSRVDTVAVVAAIVVTLVCAFLAFSVYQRHPHVPDEVAYLYQARYFAEGLLFMPAPPIDEAFNLNLMTYEATRWYSPTPPGWPAVLAIGAFLGVPWLVNPVLAGLCVLLAYLLISNLYDRMTGRLTLVLLATSPWFLFLGMSYMTHMLSLACALGAAVAVWHIRQRGSLWWGVAGGLGLAMLGVNRPLEGLIVSGLLGLWALGGPARPLMARVAGLGILGFTAMAGGSLTLLYNRALTGDPRTFPIMAYTDSLAESGNNALGFGADRGFSSFGGLDPFPGHSPFEAVINTNLNLFAVNIELLGWATGSLVFIGALMLMGRLRTEDAWLVIAILAVVFIHALYWFSGGPDFGARYWFLILVPAIALTARGIIVLGARLTETVGQAGRGLPLLVALCLTGMSATLYIPWRAADKYIHYRGMRPDIRALAKEHAFGRSVVLIRGANHPDYASAAPYNPLDLHAPVPVYVWDRGPDMYDDLIEVYGDRPLWIVNGPTRSGGGFEVVDGPIENVRSLKSQGLP